jgi:hypothetical protein
MILVVQSEDRHVFLLSENGTMGSNSARGYEYKYLCISSVLVFSFASSGLMTGSSLFNETYQQSARSMVSD